MAEDAAGNLWIGTESSGLNLFKDGKFVSYPASEDGLPGNDISCLYLDKDGVLWVGTSGHGLARFHQGKWTRYSTGNGLASNSISYIIEDDEGDLWIGSNAGLMRIPKEIAERFCRRNGEVYFLPDLRRGRRPADARMFRPVRNRPRAAPGTADCGFPPPRAWCR